MLFHQRFEYFICTFMLNIFCRCLFHKTLANKNVKILNFNLRKNCGRRCTKVNRGKSLGTFQTQFEEIENSVYLGSSKTSGQSSFEVCGQYWISDRLRFLKLWKKWQKPTEKSTIRSKIVSSTFRLYWLHPASKRVIKNNDQKKVYLTA